MQVSLHGDGVAGDGMKLVGDAEEVTGCEGAVVTWGKRLAEAWRSVMSRSRMRKERKPARHALAHERNKRKKK